MQSLHAFLLKRDSISLDPLVLLVRHQPWQDCAIVNTCRLPHPSVLVSSPITQLWVPHPCVFCQSLPLAESKGWAAMLPMRSSANARAVKAQVSWATRLPPTLREKHAKDGAPAASLCQRKAGAPAL